MVLRLDPAILSVWRSPHSLQFGIDPVRVVLDNVDASRERMIGALEIGTTAAGLGTSARPGSGAAGAGAEVAQPPRTNRRPAAASKDVHGTMDHAGRLMCVLSGPAEQRRAADARSGLW